MNAATTEPQSLHTLRRKSLHDGLFNVALFAVIGLLCWAIDFNSHSAVSAARMMFTMLIPGLIIYSLVEYFVNKRLLELDT
ncbi:hypothetical protein [Brevibacterium renqingii]|uniref:hypothetical protein n=1 Tax=Brevibacterium renqingii TaxID=2776916 RepID=UPI001AE087FF|nr:hypothetical protein [Brevibacterium renqingii]